MKPILLGLCVLSLSILSHPVRAQNPPARESAAVAGASKGSGLVLVVDKCIGGTGFAACVMHWELNGRTISDEAVEAFKDGWDQADDGLIIHVKK